VNAFRYILICCIVLVTESCRSQKIENLVLINIGNSDNGKIAEQINEVNKLNPKVISLDIAFPTFSGNREDKKLFFALQNIKKLVMPSRIHYEGQDYYGRPMLSVVRAFATPYNRRGVRIGFVSATRDNDSLRIPKQFIVTQRDYTENFYQHFSIVTAMAFDSLQAVGFIQNHDTVASVDFKNGTRKFKIFSASDVLKGKLKKEDIEGKIVMLGFLGPGDTDKFFSPFNKNSTEPDMYGVEYLANIVAQVLEYKKE